MHADEGTTRADRLVLLLLAAGGLLGGWHLFLFLTDDAYIAFRYVSNSVAGHGLVWNPAPFQPVEGYTSFLWVVLLRGVWSVTGIEPPDVANVLSLGFGALTLWIVWRLFRRMPLSGPLARERQALFIWVLLGTLSNRTFATWLSSGLETAMFNAFFVWFVFECLAPPEDRGRRLWPTRLAAAAALAALSRPDGMLCLAGAAFLIGADALERRAPARLAGAWPLLAAPAHLIWRRATYGEWLPNTYYAKYLAPWPESGVRYAASFVVEYGVWVWLILAAVFLMRRAREGSRLRPTRVWAARHAWTAVGVLVAHWGYYTFMVGGDHFEYRVYSHLVPLLWLSAVAMLAALGASARASFAVLAAWLVVSLPIPWLHWAATRDLATRERTYALAEPVADHFPWPIRTLVSEWDGWQRWLIDHNVCRRHQEHKVFHRHRVALFPTREEGSRIPWEERNVMSEGSVGILGWVLPGVAIIDTLGLNDRVVARLPPPPLPGGRQMAHDRGAPQAYVSCFRPNTTVILREGRPDVWPRPLSDRRIRACESRDWTAAALEEIRAAAQ